MALFSEIEPLSGVYVEQLLPSGTDPLGWDADEASDEALEQAGDFKVFELRGNYLKDMQIEVLEHCDNEEEQCVFIEI